MADFRWPFLQGALNGPQFFANGFRVDLGKAVFEGKLADEPLQLRLAISLHGATDEIRSRIMPINRRYPLRELAAAGEYHQAKKGRMITFEYIEYILIEGVNDGLDQVKPLAALARRLHAKVNLIPYNRVEGLPWQRPSLAAQTAFLEDLSREQVAATLRQEKGHDIDAACGQLRLKTERDMRLAGASPAAEIPASSGIGLLEQDTQKLDWRVFQPATKSAPGREVFHPPEIG